VLRLHEFLSDEYEARHEEQAGATLHLLHNATDQTIERFAWLMRKRTTAHCLTQDRGCADDSCCSISRTSNTAGLR
jgi:putative transposase